MKLKLALALLLSLTIIFAKAQRPDPDHEKVKGGELTIQPITHATLVLSYNKKNIYIDPTGGTDAFKGLAAPDIIAVTDIHGDHLDTATIKAINTANAVLVVPQAVADKLPAATTNKQKVVILKNGERTMQQGFSIAAIPMYNLPEAPDDVRLSEENQVKISMTENGDPYENALAERMNRTMKEEFGLGRVLPSRQKSLPVDIRRC